MFLFSCAYACAYVACVMLITQCEPGLKVRPSLSELHKPLIGLPLLPQIPDGPRSLTPALTYTTERQWLNASWTSQSLSSTRLLGLLGPKIALA